MREVRTGLSRSQEVPHRHHLNSKIRLLGSRRGVWHLVRGLHRNSNDHDVGGVRGHLVDDSGVQLRVQVVRANIARELEIAILVATFSQPLPDGIRDLILLKGRLNPSREDDCLVVEVQGLVRVQLEELF